MSAIWSNGALWHSGEHRVPAPTPAARGEPGWVAAVEMAALHRELGRWKTRAAELERRLAAAESRALSAQLTPHFLYNSLQAVSTLVHRDPGAADAMVVALSRLLRLVYQGAAVPEVSLERELSLLHRYVEMMRFRFGDRLRFGVDAPHELRNALVPQLLLQPLVENAIIHGLSDRAGDVRVTVTRAGGMLHCTVADNGRGLGAGPVVEGLGLGATRARLRALYGDRHRFELAANEGGGVTAFLALPYRMPLDAAEEGV